jgi:uroporphyrinogen-III synthase
MPSLLQGLTVAITRPLGQAKQLSQLLTQAGAQVVLFPLIEIVGLEDYQAFENTLDDLSHTNLAIFISTNAVEHAMPRVLARYPTLPEKLQFAAIGPTTAAALQGYGVKQVLTPEGRFDSEALLALPEMQNVQGKQVMIFRGIGGREVLADTLIARGAQVTFAESYQRMNPQTSLQALSKQGVNAIVVTSSEALRNLHSLAQAEKATWLNAVKLCVNHARIAEQAAAMGWQAVVAKTSGDAAMLDCILNAFERR